MIVGSVLEPPLPSDTEARLTQFTELLATAIANAESRAGLVRLAGAGGVTPGCNAGGARCAAGGRFHGSDRRSPRRAGPSPGSASAASPAASKRTSSRPPAESRTRSRAGIIPARINDDLPSPLPHDRQEPRSPEPVKQLVNLFVATEEQVGLVRPEGAEARVRATHVARWRISHGAIAVLGQSERRYCSRSLSVGNNSLLSSRTLLVYFG